MFIRKHISLIALGLVMVFTFSCKDDDPTEDTTAPVITITSPQDGATINAGSTVMVSGSIEEAGELNRIEVSAQFGFITQSETIQKADLPAKSGKLYQLSQEYEIPEGISGTVNITVKAYDEAGNMGNKALSLTIQ